MRIARRYVIGGRVQGVGFRYFAREAALRENVHGWVRNLSDRRVEVFAEGEADAVARFEGHIRSGPSAARVEDVDVQEEQPTRDCSGFDVRPSRS
jgi:acylphosphatase